MLDLGCGNGSGVAALLALGCEAVGCDLRLRKSGPHRDRLYREGRLRVMESPRRLPFDDETFDGVFSQNVLEHVQDYEATFSEIARVLKPNGVSVHMFPSCWTLVEGHVHVPLATFFRPYWYLLLWAWVGVRKRSQNGWSAIRTARHNRWYLTTATNYLSGRRIMDYAQRHFETRAFCERQAWLDASRIVRRFPFLRVVPVRVAAADLPYPDTAGGASAAYESTGVRVCLTLRTADPTTTAARHPTSGTTRGTHRAGPHTPLATSPTRSGIRASVRGSTTSHHAIGAGRRKARCWRGAYFSQPILEGLTGHFVRLYLRPRCPGSGHNRRIL